ncbi:MAG: hypothetical protein P8179_22980 [Candidatus Thiodiazotropha sp.]|jgi:hypothetical protein
MSKDFDDSMLDDIDEVSSELISEDLPTSDKSLDARRKIERHRELMYLRKLLDDPTFDPEFE